jgi:hypothetical protein
VREVGAVQLALRDVGRWRMGWPDSSAMIASVLSSSSVLNLRPAPPKTLMPLSW